MEHHHGRHGQPAQAVEAGGVGDADCGSGTGGRGIGLWSQVAVRQQRVADDVFRETGLNPKLEIAMELERIALEDEYFIKRKLYPNVDFYSGIIYRALGIPKSMYTVMFAIGRTVGWVAHWTEMITDPDGRIGRPRQLYTGPTTRDYIDVAKR